MSVRAVGIRREQRARRVPMPACLNPRPAFGSRFADDRELVGFKLLLLTLLAVMAMASEVSL